MLLAAAIVSLIGRTMQAALVLLAGATTVRRGDGGGCEGGGAVGGVPGAGDRGEIRHDEGADGVRARVGRCVIDWDEVMSYQVHDDRIVIVEGPVGFKRTWWFPASGPESWAEG